MVTDTNASSPGATDTEGVELGGPDLTGPVDDTYAAGRHRPSWRKVTAWWLTRKFAVGWWLAALAAVALAAWTSVLVAWGTHLTVAHRTEAAGAALLVVLAVALVVQAILVWYQGRVGKLPVRRDRTQNLAFRRRGLKAAIMGKDGRASTSKTQVVLWTVAVVWALVDLLLLTRAYSSGNLFAKAVGKNWRPEYLVLLGLPIAAATAAKAAVASTNAGNGPAKPGSSPEVATKFDVDRVYERDHVGDGVRGFVTGIAELFTGDDDAVAWADLQYVVFTLIALVYFAAQFLAQPANGLPPVPAALLTLMGISASGYVANKVVNTRGAKAK
jgi:hypothetical protein